MLLKFFYYVVLQRLLNILHRGWLDCNDSWSGQGLWDKDNSNGNFFRYRAESEPKFLAGLTSASFFGVSEIWIGVEVCRVSELPPVVPICKPMPFVRKTTICSDARTMMAKKIIRINLRKYSRPNDSADFLKVVILSKDAILHQLEFSFYC
jgi:hypothetical protein